jgi:cytochrome c oxidase subunit 1
MAISSFPAAVPPRLALWWLLLGLTALLASSLFAILLIWLRTAHLPTWLGGVPFFPVAVALHVNLAVLVWFLSFAGLLWSLAAGQKWHRVGWLAWYLAATGTGLILLSPWISTIPTDPAAKVAVMSNYLPILRTPLFLSGLALFGGGMVLLTLRACITLWPRSNPSPVSPHRMGLLAAAITLLLALLALLHAAWMLRQESASAGYYEALFWGGGHLLQCLHTFLMLTVWLWLAELAGLPVPLSQRTIAKLFLLGLLPVLSSPLFFLELHPYDAAYRLYFTQLMSYGSWLAAPAIGGAILWQWLRHGGGDDPDQRLFRHYLLFSLFLFTLGIVIGATIAGDSVTVTAHYHGTVGAITIAYMGIAWQIFSLFGFRRAMGRLHRLQPYLYGGGLTVLILGLAWLGAQEMPRKTPFALHAPLTWDAVAGVAMLGAGGLVGLLGAFLFLLLAFLRLRIAGNIKP